MGSACQAAHARPAGRAWLCAIVALLHVPHLGNAPFELPRLPRQLLSACLCPRKLLLQGGSVAGSGWRSTAAAGAVSAGGMERWLDDVQDKLHRLSKRRLLHLCCRISNVDG